MTRPRSRWRSAWLSSRTLMSPIRTEPPLISAPRRAWPSNASPTVVFPDPDSPTRPSTSPGAMLKERSLTMSKFEPWMPMWRRSTTIVGVTASPRYPRPLDAGAGARDAVADQARAHREQRNRRHREDDAPRLDGEGNAVFIDHQDPVGGAGVGCKSKKRERRNDADGVGQAQARFDEERAEDVREDFTEHDSRPWDPDRFRSRHEVPFDYRLRRTPSHAGDARHRGQAHGEDDGQRVGADGRNGDEREHDLREGEDDVHDPHQDVVEDIARVRGDQPDRYPQDQPERRRDGRQHENRQAAAEEPAPDVLTDVIGAKERPRDRRAAGRSDERARIVRGQPGAYQGDRQDKQS